MEQKSSSGIVVLVSWDTTGCGVPRYAGKCRFGWLRERNERHCIGFGSLGPPQAVDFPHIYEFARVIAAIYPVVRDGFFDLQGLARFNTGSNSSLAYQLMLYRPEDNVGLEDTTVRNTHCTTAVFS